MNSILSPSILENFLTDEEVQDLNQWTMQNYPSDFFEDAAMGLACTQYTTRYWGKWGQDQSLLVFPDVVYTIKEKIMRHFGMEDVKFPPWKDGISNYIYFDGASIRPHLDGVFQRGYYTLHCNAITQPADTGGITKIKNEQWDDWETKPKDMLCYPVTEITHYVTKCQGTTPRIMWSWAFCLKKP